MTFSRKFAACLWAALLLGMAACSQTPVSAPRSGSGEGSPQFTRLINDANAAIDEGALAAAGATLDEARALGPENPDLWLAIARLRLRGGEHLTALEAADRALAFGPDYAPALRLRGLMVRDAHGAPDALGWFDAAHIADPEDADILAEYAATLGDSGDAAAMLEGVRKLAERAPNDPRGLYFQAVLAARGQEFVLARSLLERSRITERGIPAAMLLDAAISLSQGNGESAAATLETLTARQPANPRLRELLARALMMGGQFQSVVTRFGPETKLPETSPYLLMLVARAHERLGNRAAAAPLLARAYRPVRDEAVVLALRDGLPQPTSNVRRALWNDDRGGAAAQARTLRLRFPASADVAALAGDALLGAGDPRAALTAYALASEARRPWPTARKAVWTFARHGNRAAAEVLLMRQVKGEPQTASAIIALARWKADRGEWERAARLLDHVIGLGVGHDPAVVGLRLRAALAMGDRQAAEKMAALLAEIRPRKFAAR